MRIRQGSKDKEDKNLDLELLEEEELRREEKIDKALFDIMR